MQHQELTEAIIGCAMQVHSVLGPGFLDSVYKRALAHELHKTGLQVECEKPVSVHYDGIPIGDFSVDLLVNGAVLVELKANHAISPANEVQLVNYLTATGMDVGLLLNFGGDRLDFKRKSRIYIRPHPGRQD
jgi:GxxExxY protein